MRRQREDMQVNVAGLRRNIKNLAHNYSEAQIKVREATSNDPWGPSSTLMAEIADLTYNIVAFTEIMQMIWKRLNDHGRNWRHVYKALVLLEYLIKTGSDKVASQCKENIFAIQTLKDFQYLEESKDQGQNVREKAKQLVHLLRDDERLRSERARALKAKERFAQSASGFGSDGNWWGSGSGSDGGGGPSSPRGSSGGSREHGVMGDLETARPHTVGEEELQLKLALAMSREEAEQEAQRRRSDDVRLQLALSQSEEEFKNQRPKESQSHILDLLDVNLGTPGGGAGETASAVDPWGMPAPPVPAIPKKPDPWSVIPPSSSSTSPPPVLDPWAPRPTIYTTSTIVAPTGSTSTSTTSSLPTTSDPWRPVPGPPPMTTQHPQSNQQNDPWSPTISPTGTKSAPSNDLDEFDVITNRERAPSLLANANTINNNNNNNNGISSDPFDFGLLGESLPSRTPPSNNLVQTGPSSSSPALKKTPQSFLGENSSLVNLDNLVSAKPAVPQVSTPMALHHTPQPATAAPNPFGGLRTGSSTALPRGVDPIWGGPPTASSPPNPFLS